MEQDRKPNTKPMHLWSISLQQRQLYTMLERISSTNGAGKTGQSHVKKRN